MRLSLYLFFFFGALRVAGQSVPDTLIELTEDKLPLNPLPGVFSLPDPEGNLRIEDVSQPPYQDQFNRDSTFIVGTQAYWFRFRLKNKHTIPLDISISPWATQDFTAYIFTDSSTYYTFRNGRSISPEEQPEGSNFSRIFLTIKPQEDVLIYVHTRTSHVKEAMTMRLIVRDDRFDKTYRDIVHLQAAAFLSVLAMMGLYNLVLFFFIRDRVYLYYTLMIAAAIVYFADWDYRYFSELLETNTPVSAYAASLIGLFAIQFSRKYYNTYSKLKRWDIALRLAAIGFAVQPFMYYFFPGLNAYVANFSNLLILCSVFYLVALSIYCYRKGVRAALYYLASMVFLFVFTVIYLMQPPFFNLLPATLFGAMSLKIGFIGQLLLFSIALAARINILKDEVNKKRVEAEKAEKENILKVQKVIEEKNVELEEKVMQRTEDLRQTIEELDTTNESLQELNEEVSRKNQNILASITYASRIQQAMLPSTSTMERLLGDYFVFYEPKDVVAGDFYWVGEQGDKVFIVAADCTGHGVPGAFMSMIGNELLSQAVVSQGITDTAEILRFLHEGIRKALKQEETQNPDGMDIALVVWDKAAHSLQFSGAHNPLILIQNGQLTEIKGGKYAIGGLHLKKPRVFESHHVRLSPTEPTDLYIFSDGYQDQFGGAKGRKFMRKRFRKLLLDMHTLPLEARAEKVRQVFEEWKGYKYEQTDDVLLIGVRIE